MAPAVAPWSDGLPIELLLLFLLELHCLADRASFASVCKRWRSAHKLAEREASAPPRQIPWLLFPSPAHAPSISSFLSGGRRRIYLPDDLRGARLCGSHPGGWIAAALGPCGGYLLANVFSGKTVPLPERLRQPWLQTVTPMVIRAIILSAAPTAANCLAVAVMCGASNIAFCRPGIDRYWRSGRWEIPCLQDVVYFDGEGNTRGFHAVTGSGKVWTFTPIQGPGARPVMLARSYSTMEDVLRLMPPSTSVTHYLVASRGTLLMVDRYYSRESGDRARRTFLFRVFEMQVKALPNGRHTTSWVELEGLDGRVLFVGEGCSRAFESSQLPGFEGGSIYFLDDTNFDLSSVMKSEGEYPCSDMGMYSMSQVARPGLHPPTMRSPIYGAQTSVACVKYSGNNPITVFENIFEGNDGATISFLEMRANEEEHNENNITGTFWSFPSELLSKLSPPIWFSP